MEKISPTNEKPSINNRFFWIDFFIGFLAWFVIHGIGWAVFDSIAPSFIPDGIGLVLLCLLIPLPANILSLIFLYYKRLEMIAFGVIMAIFINSTGILLVKFLKYLDISPYQRIGWMYPFFLLLLKN